jgi:hypothetical protein
MKQRVPRRAWFYGVPRNPPRLLIEDDHPALAISDFSLFERAGFAVAFCSGPGDDPAACPLLAGEDCEVAAGADVILHGLDPESGVAAAIRDRYPATPVLVSPGGARVRIPGCVPLPAGCSVAGQVEALNGAPPVTGQVRRRSSRLRGRGSRRRCNRQRRSGRRPLRSAARCRAVTRWSRCPGPRRR